MNCKDKKKFKTAEASSKASLRTKGAIDAFLNILDVNKFNKLNKEWTVDAVKRFDITGKLFYNENDKAVANKEAFKQIDNAKGVNYSINENKSISNSIFESDNKQIIKSLQKFAKDKKVNLNFVDFKDEKGFTTYGSYDKKTNSVNLNENNIDSSTFLHEISHPFVTYLNSKNPELFNKVYKEAKKLYPEISSFLDIEAYSNMPESWKQEEYIVRAIEKEYKIKDLKVRRSILNKFLDFIKELFGIENNIKISEDATIKDLYQIILSNNVVKLDVKMTDNIARRELENIENYFDIKISNTNEKLLALRGKLSNFKDNVKIGDFQIDNSVLEEVGPLEYEVTKEIYDNQLFNITDAIDNLETQIEALESLKKQNQIQIRKNIKGYYNIKPEIDRVNFNDLIGSKKNEVTSNESQENSETNSNLDTNQTMLFGTKSLKDSFTSTEVLQNIINSNLDLSASTINLIDKATKLLRNSKTRVKVISQEQFDKMTTNSEGEGTAVMAYNYDLGSVIYMPESTLSNFSNLDIVSSFLHEVAHELSLKAILNPETMSEIAFNEFITKAFEQYKYLGKGLNNSNSYGFTNIQEFVAELYSNDKFQNEIKSLDKNFWQRFISELRRLLGLPKSLRNDNLIDSILLIEKVNDFINENDSQLENYKLAGLKSSRILAKRIEDDSQYSSLESKIDNFIAKAKKAMQSIQERTIKSNRKKSTESKEENIRRNKELLDTLTKYETSQKWKAVVGYTQSFNNTINQVNDLLDKLLNTKNIYEDQLESTIKRYKDYLSAYDLLPEIKELMSQADLKLFELTDEEKEDYQQLKDFLSKAKEKHDAIESKFLAISKAQVLQDFSNPLFNTEVETKQREFLIREYNSLSDKGGLSVEQYVSKMLTTRDKDDYEVDLKASAEKILNDPSQDISGFSAKLDDQLNTKSKLIQVVNQMLGASFDAVKTLTVTKIKEMSKTFEKFIKEKGNVKLSVLNKNLIEKDSEGNVYLKGKYSLAFKEAFDNELRPVLNARRDYYESSIELGLEEGDILSSDKYKAFNYQISQWYKKYTTKDSKRKTIPKAEYLNKPLTGTEKEILDGYIKINQDNNEIEGFDSLITNIAGAEFHKLPSQSKSDLERALEADFKGITKDKWNDLTKIRTDDIGIDSGSEEKNSQGDILRRVKTAYRGKIDANEQSLDLETMFRNEYWNGQNVKEKLRLEPKLLMITDIAKDKEYYTGKNKEVVAGLSNTYNRLVGLMERNVYDVMSKSGGTFAGADINKVTSALNGYAAGLAMTFNLASGVTNVANGLTQVLIESVGGNRFNTKTFLKAEARYTKEMMNGNLLKNMSKSVKTSYFNQLLEMFDVMGGLGQNEQEALRNTILRKFGTTKSGNFLNESGEHAMHAILTESILDGIKAMDVNNNYLDKDGNVTTENKGASLADMLYFDNNGQLQMNSKVAYSGFNLTTKYHEGGKSQINLLIKHKVFDLFGVYDIKYKNELSKAWWGKSIMMFKNFFMGAANYRYTGFATSYKKKSDLSEDDKFYNSAEKEYIEGTYTTLVRFLRETGVPNLKSLQTMYMNWNNLTEYEKSNVKKATMEIMLTAVILPSIGLLMAGMDDDDDESNLLWFAMYVNRRLTRELAQFRNPIEASKMIQNPVAGIRFIQNGLNFIYDVATPINFAPVENESIFGYLDENSKGENKMSKHLTKLIPIIPQMGVDYRQRFGLEFK